MSDKQTADKIIKCPFCGNKAELFQRGLVDSDYDCSKDTDSWDIRCTSIECYLCNGADWWLEKKYVIKLWNTHNSLVSEDVSKSNHCVSCAIEWAKRYETDEQIAVQKIEKYLKCVGGLNLVEVNHFKDWLDKESE